MFDGDTRRTRSTSLNSKRLRKKRPSGSGYGFEGGFISGERSTPSETQVRYEDEAGPVA